MKWKDLTPLYKGVIRNWRNVKPPLGIPMKRWEIRRTRQNRRKHDRTDENMPWKEENPQVQTLQNWKFLCFKLQNEIQWDKKRDITCCRTRNKRSKEAILDFKALCIVKERMGPAPPHPKLGKRGGLTADYSSGVIPWWREVVFGF